MTNLTLANQELFRRTPDECFPSLEALYAHCAKQRSSSEDHWERPQDVTLSGEMQLSIGETQQGRGLNAWPFSHLCRMAGVSKDTINRLSYSTASRVSQETLPSANKPLQIRTKGSQARSVHGVAVKC